jgi:predicted DNA-binding protein
VIRSEKRLKELSGNLNRKNKSAVPDAIRALREEEPFEGAIGLLASFYDGSEEKGMRKTIEEFFNDIKDQSARIEVISEIRKPWRANTIRMLVASCWQSGLDYSDYLTDMARTFLNGDYATSIECMTVIEESVLTCSRERKDEIIKIIEDSPLSGIYEKSALILELISILER